MINVDSPEERGRVEVHVRVGEKWASADFDDEKYDEERVIAVLTYGMAEEDMLRISRRIADR